MANDIMKAISGNNIKNGTLIAGCTFTGTFSVNNNYVKNTPIIGDIEDKYDNRFDDPSYYYGVNGDVLGV